MTTIINLYAGAGAGKSTTASKLFQELKIAGYKCELVTEYAKEAYYDNTLFTTDQISVSGEQWKRVRRLIDKVDYIITDSPVLLGIAYARSKEETEAITPLLRYYDSKYPAINVWINRSGDYQTYGREQTEERAKHYDRVIRELVNVDIEIEKGCTQPIIDYIKYFLK